MASLSRVWGTMPEYALAVLLKGVQEAIFS